MNSHGNRKFLEWCRRYIGLSQVAIIGIVVYILFFTDSSIADTYRYEKEIDARKAMIKAETDTMNYYRRQLRNIVSDPLTMERVAREQYHMQRPGEDIYIVR